MSELSPSSSPTPRSTRTRSLLVNNAASYDSFSQSPHTIFAHLHSSNEQAAAAAQAHTSQGVRNTPTPAAPTATAGVSLQRDSPSILRVNTAQQYNSSGTGAAGSEKYESLGGEGYTSPGRRSYHPLTDYIKTPTQFSSFTQKLPYLLLTLAILVALITCTALFVPRSNHMALLSTASISDLSFNQDSVGNTVSFSYTLYTTLHNRNFVSLHLQSVLIFANLIMNQTMAQPPVDSTVSNSSSSSSSLGDSLLSTIAATASSLLSPLPASTLSLRSLDDPSLYLVPLGRFPDFTSATVSARDTQTVLLNNTFIAQLNDDAYDTLYTWYLSSCAVNGTFTLQLQALGRVNYENVATVLDTTPTSAVGVCTDNILPAIHQQTPDSNSSAMS